MSNPGRPLQAALTPLDDSSKGEDSLTQSSSLRPGQQPNPGGRPKRTLIESACAACRKRKSRVRVTRTLILSFNTDETNSAMESGKETTCNLGTVAEN